MEKPKEQPPSYGIISFKFTQRHLMVIGVLAMAFTVAFLMRSLPLEYGFYINEFDPYFDYRATKFLVENGLEEYFAWHDTMSWYPEGRDIAGTSQTGLHLSAAYLYSAFGGGAPLYDFVAWFPVVMGSLTAIVLFALVRTVYGTTAGLFASFFFALSPAIIQRGNLGWFKSEPLGLFLGILALYLLLSALKHRDYRFAIAKAVVGGLILGFAMTAWGGIQYFALLLGIFFLALPFFTKEARPSIYVVPIFAALTIAVASSFPRPGETFPVTLTGLSLIAPAIFLIVANIIRSFSARNKTRNMLGWLTAFVGSAVAVVAGGAYSAPDLRYLSVVNPFSKSDLALVASVSEHFTPTMVDYIANFSILLPLAAYGAFLCFRKRDNMTVFALILAFTGLYVSASITRLMVFGAVGIIMLASIAFFEVTSSVFARAEAPAAQQPKKKVKVQSSRKDFRIAYTVLIIGMLVIPVFYPPNANWIALANIPPTIANGSTSFRISTNDWTHAMEWLKTSTEPGAVIASWWDYGYWITTLGERASLADNATINATRIETIAKALISDEQTGLSILRDLKADYVLVYIVGTRATLGNQGYMVLGGGGDESKKQWFMRIGGFDENNYLEDDGITPKPFFWENTLLGKLFPVQPAGYVRVERGVPVDIQASYRLGYVPLYVEQVKYPDDGSGPFKLVYASPSFVDKKSSVVLGILVYKVTGEEVAPPAAPEQPPVKESKELEPFKDYAVLEISVGGQSAGEITMELLADVAPETAGNFMELVDTGFYDGIKIHRIVPDFVIQGGDPNTKTGPRSTWGTGGPGYAVPAEISDLSHTRGMVAMAHPGDPNQAGSQFFIVVKDAPFLDGQYTIFGRVVDGMDLVDRIAALPRDQNDIPLTDVVIERAYTLET